MLILTGQFDPLKWARLKKVAASVDVEFEKGLSQSGPEEQVIQQEAKRKQAPESHRWAFQQAPCKAAWPFFQLTPHATSSYCSKSTLSSSRGETHSAGSHAGACLIKHSNIYRENYSTAGVNILIQRIDFLFCPNELVLDEKHSAAWFFNTCLSLWAKNTDLVMELTVNF